MKIKQIRADGYKNLIDCTVNLGDFNVLVGPNNSGKSNLLEALQMIGGICFGSEKLRKEIFEGLTPPNRQSSWICHLKKYNRRPLTIGLSFEMAIGKAEWLVDYEVKIKSAGVKSEKGGFVSERLCAKSPVDKSGPPTTYIDRDGEEYEVRKKNKKRVKKAIQRDISALNAILSVYPEFMGLPEELRHFVDHITVAGFTRIFAIWPDGLRMFIDDEEESMDGMHITYFDPLQTIDKIKTESKEDFELFEDAVCDILDLEELNFIARTIGGKESKGKKEGSTKRVRICTARTIGNESSPISEFSNGTFAVIGILSALMSKEYSMPLFCVEELENCLHPAAIEKLLRFLQDNADRWPVLITTHSSYLLNGVSPEAVNVAVVHETGATHFERVKNTRGLQNYLNKSFMSFGDLLRTDFGNFRENVSSG